MTAADSAVTAAPAAPAAGWRSLSPAWRLAVVLLLVVAGAPRVWYAAKALPFFDERYSIANLEAMLDGSQSARQNAYYTRLSYLPQGATLLLVRGVERAMGKESAPFISAHQLSPRAQLICRLWVVIYALGSLLVLFLLVLRWFPPTVAFFAAALLAATRLHFRLSVNFKPDMLVLLLVLVAVWVANIALERRKLGWYLAAGVAGGLAASAKLTGGVALLPLGVVTLARVRRHRAALLWLVGAGVLAAITFVAINGGVVSYLKAYSNNLEAYEGKVAIQAHGRQGSVVYELLVWLLSSGGHGAIVGTLALAGIPALCVWAWLRRRQETTWPVAAIFLFPLSYTVLYCLATDLFKPNNFLLVLPFTALGAAWLGACGWEWGSKRLPLVARTPVAAVCAVAVVLIAAAPTYGYVRDEVFESTWDVALGQAAKEAARLGSPVSVVMEGRGRRAPAKGVAVTPVPRLADAHAALDCSDGALFASASPAADGDWRRQRFGSAPAWSFGPSLLRGVTGPPVSLVLHPLRLAATEMLELSPAGGTLEARPRGSYAAGDCVSLTLGPRTGLGADPRLEIDRRELVLRHLGAKRVGWSSNRFAVPSPPSQVRLRLGSGADASVAPRVRMLLWKRGEGAAEAPPAE